MFMLEGNANVLQFDIEKTLNEREKAIRKQEKKKESASKASSTSMQAKLRRSATVGPKGKSHHVRSPGGL